MTPPGVRLARVGGWARPSLPSKMRPCMQRVGRVRGQAGVPAATEPSRQVKEPLKAPCRGGCRWRG